MTEQQLDELKADFLEWSGGFEPETDEKIDIHITSSMPLNIADDDARTALKQWRDIASAVGRII